MKQITRLVTTVRLALFGLLFLLSLSVIKAGQTRNSPPHPPIHITFLWHMHQPIYWPYETVVQTDANGRYGYSVTDIHNQRLGPYSGWPKDAVQSASNAGLRHAGAQAIFSGSLSKT